MKQTVQEKAKAYLVDGRVLVLRADYTHAEFAVQGSDSKPYIVQLPFGSCTCPARTVECVHIIACKLIYKITSTAHSKLFTSDLDYLFSKNVPVTDYCEV